MNLQKLVSIFAGKMMKFKVHIWQYEWFVRQLRLARATANWFILIYSELEIRPYNRKFISSFIYYTFSLIPSANLFSFHSNLFPTQLSRISRSVSRLCSAASRENRLSLNYRRVITLHNWFLHGGARYFISNGKCPLSIIFVYLLTCLL